MDKDEMRETVLESETVFSGKVITLQHQRVRLPGGGESMREIVRHPGAVAVLAEPAADHLIFVEQYRLGPDEVLLEIPAGKLEPDESAMDCAKRELEEETGYRSGCLNQLYTFYTSPGFADEKIALFAATELRQGRSHLDEDEFLNVRTLHRDEILHLLQDGAFHDAKTLVAVLWWLRDKRQTW